MLGDICDNYLLTYEYGKYLIKICKETIEKNNFIFKDKTISLVNSTKFISLISKYISNFYFQNKAGMGKYLCKVAFSFYAKNEGQYNLKVLAINLLTIKNNLACIYCKEKKYTKSLEHITSCLKRIDGNGVNNSNDYLVYLNNYLNIYFKSNKEINTYVLNKINTMKILIDNRVLLFKEMNVYLI